MIKKYLIALVLVGIILLETGVTYAAAPSSQPQGLLITPTIVRLDFSKPETKDAFTITLANNTKTVMQLDTSKLNFNGQTNTGSISFVNPDDTQPTSALAASLFVTPTAITLEPGQKKQLTVSIVNPNNLSPGGHYGSVVFTDKTNLREQGNKVGISQAVSVLVFVTTKNGGIKDIKLLPPELPVVTWDLPKKADVFFRNVGNTHTAPVGTVRILHDNTLVTSGIINTDSGLVLPSSTRLYTTMLSTYTAKQTIGRYKLVVTYGADASSPSKTYEKTFLYIDKKFLGLTCATLLTLGAVLVKLYRRRHIAQA